MEIKKLVGYIRDPIYDYIVYTVAKDSEEITEKQLIDTPAFQRLRRIFQLQTIRLVYPGAMHTRFAHSLGVMHLAGKFARILYKRYIELFGKQDLPEEEYVVEIFRLAGLLHDIGHGPFGHTLDEIYSYKKYNVTHEQIAQKIICEKMGELITNINRSPFGRFETKISPETIIRLIKPDTEFNSIWERNFSKIIYGLYSVDKIDYLLRDSYYCGTPEFGIVDLERLFNSSYITDKELVLDKNSIPVLKAFLWSRFFMYENVYFHRTVRAIDLALSEVLEAFLDLIELGNPLENLDRFLMLDDFSIAGIISSWENSSNKKKREVYKKWNNIINLRKIEWKLAYQKEILTKEGVGLLLDLNTLYNRLYTLLRARLRDDIEFIVDLPYLDIRPENPIANINRLDTIAVYDPITKSIDREAILSIFEGIPTKFISVRIFCKPENIRFVNNVAKEVLSEFGFSLQITSY